MHTVKTILKVCKSAKKHVNKSRKYFVGKNRVAEKCGLLGVLPPEKLGKQHHVEGTALAVMDTESHALAGLPQRLK